MDPAYEFLIVPAIYIAVFCLCCLLGAALFWR